MASSMILPNWLRKKDAPRQANPASIVLEEDKDAGDLNIRSNVDYSGARSKTSKEEKLLVRKLDLYMMPMLWVMYFLNYVDRAAIASARLNHIEKHLGVTYTQWQTAVSMLFVGYVLMQVPSNMLMVSGYVRPSLYMGLCMCVWAVVSGCTALVTGYKGLLFVRLALGIAEAPFFAGALFTLSSFYTRKEIAARISILYSANIIAMATSGPIAAGIFGTMHGALGIYGWQWLFIIEGSITFVAGLLGACILPDKPISTKWLTEAQQQLAVERIEADTVGLTENQGFRKTFKGLCTNWNLLTFVFLQMMHLSSVGFNNYFPTIIKSLGFSTQQSLYLTAPPFLLAVFVSYGAGLLSGWLNERTFIITASMVLAIIGFAMCGAVHNHSIRYLSTFLFTSGGYSVNCVILGWVSATLGQTQQHKALAYGMVNTMGNASYVYSSFLYRKDTEPQYEIAMYANVAFSFLVIVCTHILRWRLRKANRKIQEEEEVALANGQDVPRRLRYCY